MKALILLALGYLVDFFDLTLFAAARADILNSFNVQAPDIIRISRNMFNAQAIGIVLGGLFSGVWGDKIGRMSSVRVGIFIYSTAILCSIYTTSVEWFIFFRFLAGIGLAGELASSVTFMTEAWEGKARDFAVSIIYFSGVLGGILATILSEFVHWKTLFLIGSLAGFGLLVLRISIKDSELFQNLKNHTAVSRGSLKILFFTKDSFLRVLKLTLVLVPFWFMVYFINFGPEIAKQIGLKADPLQSVILGCFFVGSVFGTYLLHYLSTFFQSRKKTLTFIFVWMFVVISSLLLGPHLSLFAFYSIMFMLGIGCGYPGIYCTLAAESFGTNQRTTGTCVVSCFGRGSFVVINFFVPWAILYTGSSFKGIIVANGIVFVIAMASLLTLNETHKRSIDFIDN